MSLQEVREQNIALVKQTALACFVENGIDKTTIRDIAHRAGLTERSVYRYFATKDELVVAAAFLYWDRAKAQAAQALVSARQPGMTGIEEIRVLLRSYAGLIFTDPAGCDGIAFREAEAVIAPGRTEAAGPLVAEFVRDLHPGSAIGVGLGRIRDRPVLVELPVDQNQRHDLGLFDAAENGEDMRNLRTPLQNEKTQKENLDIRRTKQTD